MWTERERVITNFDEAIEYIESKECFHDYRLGNIDIGENCIKIMIEEDTGNEHNNNAHIWDFSFHQTSNLKVVMDCVLTPYIDEVSIENQEMDGIFIHICRQVYMQNCGMRQTAGLCL